MIEYSVLFIIIIGAFLVMKNYIQRGIYSNWAKSGQSYAFGRQYDPQKTIDCAFDQVSGNWYDYNCSQYYITQGLTIADIIQKDKCSGSYCNQLNNGLTGQSLL